MESGHEFEKNMNQLVQLLKKILGKHFPQAKGYSSQSFSQEQGVNLNIYLLNMVTPLSEDFDDWEELLEQFSPDRDQDQDGFSDKLTHSDLEFLRRNGISF